MAQDNNLEVIARAICDQVGYQFVRRAGHGAFKETFLVYSGSHSVALKVYRSDRRNEREAREVDAMRRCNHPAIARLLSLDQFSYAGNEYLYLTEEFITGGTLADWVANNGALDTTSLVTLGTRLIDAVSHIASHRLVHRDLKPENVLLHNDLNTATIVDFGLVRDLDATSITGTWAIQGPGTPYYAAPEQLNNAKSLINWRTDQFSLGVLLTVVATGKHPYSFSDNKVAAVEAVCQHRGPSAEFREWCEVENLPTLAQMVEPWPIQRYRTPHDLAVAWKKQTGE